MPKIARKPHKTPENAKKRQFKAPDNSNKAGDDFRGPKMPEIAGLEEDAPSTHNTFMSVVAICKSIIGRTKIFHIILNLKVYGGKSLVLKKVLRAHITPL